MASRIALTFAELLWKGAPLLARRALKFVLTEFTDNSDIYWRFQIKKEKEAQKQLRSHFLGIELED